MTAQIPETLLYEGERLSMCSEPLADFFAFGGVNPGFQAPSTSLWRGYVGEWEIIEGRLYLIGLNGTLKDGSRATLATLFPDFPHRVFAHWYSGTIRVPQGMMLKYVHMAYASTYERDFLLTIEMGVLTNTEVRHNGRSESPSGPKGYQLAAVTTFPQHEKSSEVGP